MSQSLYTIKHIFGVVVCDLFSPSSTLVGTEQRWLGTGDWGFNEVDANKQTTTGEEGQTASVYEAAENMEWPGTRRGSFGTVWTTAMVSVA
jgi:hypothetical protein